MSSSGSIYQWTGSLSVNLGDIGNWFDVTTGAAATSLPGARDQADIAASGFLIGTGNFAGLSLTGTSAGLGLFGTITAAAMSLDGPLELGDSGTLTLSGAGDINFANGC